MYVLFCIPNTLDMYLVLNYDNLKVEFQVLPSSQWYMMFGQQCSIIVVLQCYIKGWRSVLWGNTTSCIILPSSPNMLLIIMDWLSSSSNSLCKKYKF